MPWLKLKNVPANVRKHSGVPLTLAQANWVANIADGLEDDPDIDEPWAVAWSRFVKSYRIEGKRWVKRKVQGASQMLIFVNDAQPLDVTFEKADGGTLVKGLPLMRPGTYNGIKRSAETLQEIADNFAVIQEQDAFVPALMPHHQYDHDGKVVPMDASEVHGYFEALIFDTDADTLRGDVLVLDAEVVEDIKDGTLRYLSTEVDTEYRLAEGEEELGLALIGAAWVTYPACRGMPMNIIANAQDFPVYIHGLGLLSSSQLQGELTRILASRAIYKRDEDKGVYGPYIREVFEDRVIVEHANEYWQHDYTVDGDKVSVKIPRKAVRQDWVVSPAQAAAGVEQQTLLQAVKTYLGREGGKKMATLKQKILAALGRIESGEEPEEDLEKLVGELPDEDAPVVAAGEPGQPVEEDSSVQAQLEQLRRGNEEMHLQMEEQKAQHRKESVNIQLDALVTAGVVSPALRSQTFVILDILMREDKKITVLGEEDPATGKHAEKQHEAKDVFIDVLRQVSAGVSTGPIGLVYEGEMVLPSSESDADEIGAGDDMVKRMRAQAGFKPDDAQADTA